MTQVLTVALFAIARPTFDVPLAQATAQAALDQLEEAGFSVVGTGAELLMDGAAADRAVAALQADPPHLVLLLQASFADSTMAVQIARAAQPLGTPLLLWAVPDQRSGGRLRLNSLCGINLAAHALTQQKIAYDYIHAETGDGQIPALVSQLARAGRARRRLQEARIGLVGEHPAGFDTCAYDPQHLAELFGAAVVPLALEETLTAAGGADQAARDRFIARAGSYAANLAQMDQQAVRGTAGVYATLRQEADQRGLSGIAVRCWPEFFTELGCAACGAMSMLNEEQCPASCEADVNGTLTSLLLQSLSESPAFITDLVSIDSDDNSAVLWHCGLAPVSMADPAADILATVHSNRKLPLLFEFPLKPGRVTVARLHRADPEAGTAGYRLVVGGGEMLARPKSFGGTSGVIRFDQPAQTVLDTIMQNGLEHHFNITYGDWQAELCAFARLVGLDVLTLT